MSKYITLLVIILLLVLCFPFCNKEEKGASVVVTVVTFINSAEEKVEDATVRVYCTEPGCIIDDTKKTNAYGESAHAFDHEAVLAIETIKVVPFDTLYGTGIADLVKGKTIAVRVEIK
ncbi:MAG: hypothetical protein ABII90_13925 [Bacteroidota bacterium]